MPTDEAIPLLTATFVIVCFSHEQNKWTHAHGVCSSVGPQLHLQLVDEFQLNLVLAH